MMARDERGNMSSREEILEIMNKEIRIHDYVEVIKDGVEIYGVVTRKVGHKFMIEHEFGTCWVFAHECKKL